MEITIETTVSSTIERVWQAWTTPKDVMNWNFASDDWCCPKAFNNLEVGERFNYRMEAKDGSAGFDFEGTYTLVDKLKQIEFRLFDERKVSVLFEAADDGVRVTETFEAEDQNPVEMQRQGWQSILNNFKKHVERGN